MGWLEKMNSRLLFLSLCLFVFHTNSFCPPIRRYHNSAAKLEQITGHGSLSRIDWDNAQRNPSSMWNVVSHPLFLMCAGLVITPIANKTIIPGIEYGIDGIQGAWIHFTYSPEKQEARKKAEETRKTQVIKNFNESEIKYQTALRNSERGKLLLAKQEEQNHRIQEQLLDENDITINEAKKDPELRKAAAWLHVHQNDIAFIEDCMTKTSDPETLQKLHEKREQKIREFAHSKT